MNTAGSRPGGERDAASDRPEYCTTDLDLASFLAARGFPSLRVEPPPPNTFPRFSVFVFKHCPEVDEALADWIGHEPLTIDLRAYRERHRDLFRWARSVARGGGR